MPASENTSVSIKTSFHGDTEQLEPKCLFDVSVK